MSDVVRVDLDADPERYDPPGGHHVLTLVLAEGGREVDAEVRVRRFGSCARVELLVHHERGNALAVVAARPWQARR